MLAVKLGSSSVVRQSEVKWSVALSDRGPGMGFWILVALWVGMGLVSWGLLDLGMRHGEVNCC